MVVFHLFRDRSPQQWYEPDPTLFAYLLQYMCNGDQRLLGVVETNRLHREFVYFGLTFSSFFSKPKLKKIWLCVFPVKQHQLIRNVGDVGNVPDVDCVGIDSCWFEWIARIFWEMVRAFCRYFANTFWVPISLKYLDVRKLWRRYGTVENMEYHTNGTILVTFHLGCCCSSQHSPLSNREQHFF